MGRSDMVFFGMCHYLSTLDFAFLFKNKQFLSAFSVKFRQRTSKRLREAIKL